MLSSRDSLHVVESKQRKSTTQILPERIELSYQPLAILYEQLLADLDELFRKVAFFSSADLEHNIPTEAKHIEEFLYRFQLWASDIAFRTPTKVGSTAEVLQALDDTKSPATIQLRKVFQEMLPCIRLATVAVSE